MSNSKNTDFYVPDKVPGDVNMKDKRRFRVIPLRVEEIDRAGIGEVVLDRETGDVWTIREDGTPVSRTQNLEKILTQNITSDLNSLFYMNNRNRRVYRLFFNDDIVRLDTNLILDKENYYYRIRDIEDNAKYYVATLTPIKEPAPLLFTMADNQIYFVELYNKHKEMISMLPFSAKAALEFDVDDREILAVTSLEIHTNKDFMYQNENIDSLMIKLYANFEDGTQEDITDYNSVSITHDIDTSTIGEYTIEASWLYNIEDDVTIKTDRTFEVVEDKTATISDLVVLARKVVNLNDGSKEIRLQSIVYYADGTTEDVSDRVVVSNFDDELFNEPQLICVKLNAGVVNVWSETYTIQVNDDGGSSNYKILFSEENFLKLDETNRDVYPDDTVYYKVRSASDLDFFFTPDYNELHYSAIFRESAAYKIATATNVIVEFYDASYNLIESDVYTCQYVANLTSYTIYPCDGTMYVASDTNVYREAIDTSFVIGELKVNDMVDLTGNVDNGWFRIKYENSEGFVPKSVLSPEEIDDTNYVSDTINAVNRAFEYTYDDYAYATEFEMNLTGENNLLITGNYTELGKDIMNDFARLMGALYRIDDGESISEITFGDVKFTWNQEGELLGSNWIDSTGQTLVSKVVGLITATKVTSINLRINRVNVKLEFIITKN